jgi:hypothetical protein
LPSIGEDLDPALLAIARPLPEWNELPAHLLATDNPADFGVPDALHIVEIVQFLRGIGGRLLRFSHDERASFTFGAYIYVA